MDALARLVRELDQALRRHQRRGLVAPHRMRARITLDAQRFAVVEAVLVLGVERGTAADHLKDAAQAFVVLHQQRAGRGADKDFDAGATRRTLQHRQVLHVFAGAADEESKIAMHAMMGALHLVGEGGLRHGQWRGVRHLEHGGDAAHHCAARAGLKVFLLLQPGLAEMHLRVHDAGQDVQALAVDHFGGGSLRQRADIGNAAVDDADIAGSLAVLVDDSAALEDQVETLGHGWRPLSSPSARLEVLSFLPCGLTFRSNMSQEIFV
ncbi:hypothetical protein ACVWWP_006781 [Bradyrhizobium sp. LM3.6]